MRFRIDTVDTTEHLSNTRDTTMGPEAAARLNVKGRDALTDLHVAMTRHAALLAEAQTRQPESKNQKQYLAHAI